MPDEIIAQEYDALAEAATKQVTLAETAIDRHVADLEKLIAQARGYAPEAAIATDFARAFPPDEPGYMGQMRSTVGTGVHSLNGLLIMWDAKRLQDVTPRLKWLAARLGKYTISDYPEMQRRTYNFGNRLQFSVFFNDAKTVCKFVEVGKKEEPIYKLMCGEEEVSEVLA